MNRPFRPLAAVALVALISAGCSTAPAEDANGGTDRQTQAVKFSQCMRDNGVSDFPDPDASGELTIDGVVNGTSVDPDSVAWTKAIDACEGLQPSGFTGHTRSAEQQEYALKFAQCIRENGVKDFPDPTRDSPLVDTNRIPSAATEGGMTILHAAMGKCEDEAAGAGVRK